MQSRIPYDKSNSAAYQAMLRVEGVLATCSLEKPLLDLIRLRVSQINGCAFCIDMHWREMRENGESEQRLYGLTAWQESPYYSERERAAVRWADEVTRLAEGGVSDAAFDSLHAHFSDQQIIDLTWAVAAINTWNRINVAFRTIPAVT